MSGALTDIQIIERASAMVDTLCDNPRAWVMSVPARPDKDSDLVIDEALMVAKRLLAERDEARALAEEACRRFNESLRVPTCIYCFHAFPPSTPRENADAARAHAETCEKHPMSALRAERDVLVATIETLRRVLGNCCCGAFTRSAAACQSCYMDPCDCALPDHSA